MIKQWVYIAGPYRGATICHTRQNIREAEAMAIKYWQAGYYVYCPHLNSAFMDGAVPDSVFLDAHLSMLLKCDIIVMMPRWRQSAGAVSEHELARLHDMEVRYE